MSEASWAVRPILLQPVRSDLFGNMSIHAARRGRLRSHGVHHIRLRHGRQGAQHGGQKRGQPARTGRRLGRLLRRRGSRVALELLGNFRQVLRERFLPARRQGRGCGKTGRRRQAHTGPRVILSPQAKIRSVATAVLQLPQGLTDGQPDALVLMSEKLGFRYRRCARRLDVRPRLAARAVVGHTFAWLEFAKFALRV